MQMPVIGNVILNQKWNNKENMAMSKRLSTVKTKVNKKCPESFAFSKNRVKHPGENFIDSKVTL